MMYTVNSIRRFVLIEVKILQDVYITALATCFHDIDDPRMDRTKFHVLQNILFIAICAVICGAEGPTAIAEYAHDKRDWLKTFLTLPNDIPSHDTIGRVIALLDPRQFQSCFLRWIQEICHLLPGEVVAIDGKRSAIQLKKNQERLLSEVQELFEQAVSARPLSISLDYCETINQANGRREVRRH